jgi:ribonuclease P protein component
MAARSFRPDAPVAPAEGLARLKKRADFLRAQKGVRRVTPSLTLEACVGPAETTESRTTEGRTTPGGLRVGFTATKKLGNAVTRNRAKRRLRAAAAQVLPGLGQAGRDYVLVARPGTLDRDFAQLTEDLASALRAAHLKLDLKGEPS